MVASTSFIGHSVGRRKCFGNHGSESEGAIVSATEPNVADTTDPGHCGGLAAQRDDRIGIESAPDLDRGPRRAAITQSEHLHDGFLGREVDGESLRTIWRAGAFVDLTNGEESRGIPLSERVQRRLDLANRLQVDSYESAHESSLSGPVVPSRSSRSEHYCIALRANRIRGDK